jgi:hypothetical protein
MPKISNIVLVHGGFVDGAGWRGVYDILKKDGFNVGIVHSPTSDFGKRESGSGVLTDSHRLESHVAA